MEIPVSDFVAIYSRDDQIDVEISAKSLLKVAFDRKEDREEIFKTKFSLSHDKCYNFIHILLNEKDKLIFPNFLFFLFNLQKKKERN